MDWGLLLSESEDKDKEREREREKEKDEERDREQDTRERCFFLSLSLLSVLFISSFPPPLSSLSLSFSPSFSLSLPLSLSLSLPLSLSLLHSLIHKFKDALPPTCTNARMQIVGGKENHSGEGERGALTQPNP